ncbi:MAG: hypothetical protein M3256_10195 [Actinomycetota bacterium]|nr:hypothetical protein [Actinomycetota bacterium]
MRTSRLARVAFRLVGASALLVLLTVPSPAGAQPATCSRPGLGPPTACVDPEGGSTTTSPAPGQPATHDPGAALWVGVAFGVSGLAGIVFANVRVRVPEPEEQG